MRPRDLEAGRLQVQMAFACENVKNDPAGPVSFEKVMDGMAAVDFPATTGRWFAIFCFFSQAQQCIANCRVVVASENGEVVAQTALKDLTFTTDRQVSRSVVGFHGVAWPYPGRYFIRFIANRDDELASFPMLVKHVPDDPGGT